MRKQQNESVIYYPQTLTPSAPPSYEDSMKVITIEQVLDSLKALIESKKALDDAIKNNKTYASIIEGLKNGQLKETPLIPSFYNEVVNPTYELIKQFQLFYDLAFAYNPAITEGYYEQKKKCLYPPVYLKLFQKVEEESQEVSKKQNEKIEQVRLGYSNHKENLERAYVNSAVFSLLLIGIPFLIGTAIVHLGLKLIKEGKIAAANRKIKNAPVVEKEKKEKILKDAKKNKADECQLALFRLGKEIDDLVKNIPSTPTIKAC